MYIKTEHMKPIIRAFRIVQAWPQIENLSNIQNATVNLLIERAQAVMNLTNDVENIDEQTLLEIHEHLREVAQLNDMISKNLDEGQRLRNNI